MDYFVWFSVNGSFQFQESDELALPINRNRGVASLFEVFSFLVSDGYLLSLSLLKSASSIALTAIDIVSTSPLLEDQIYKKIEKIVKFHQSSEKLNLYISRIYRYKVIAIALLQLLSLFFDISKTNFFFR